MIDIPYPIEEAKIIIKALSDREIGLPYFLHERLEQLQPGDFLRPSWQRNVLPWDIIKLAAYTGYDYEVYKHNDPIHPYYIIYCFLESDIELLDFLVASGKISLSFSVKHKENDLIATDRFGNYFIF